MDDVVNRELKFVTQKFIKSKRNFKISLLIFVKITKIVNRLCVFWFEVGLLSCLFVLLDREGETNETK